MLPVYNGQDFVESSIQSILSQTYPEIYPIVYNDGSKDRTQVILDRLASDNPRLKVLSCPDNKGLPSADNFIRRHILDNTRHEYIAWIACDDQWRKDKTQVQMEFMLAHRDIDITYTDTVYRQSDKAEEVQSPEFDPNLLLYVNYINGSSVIMKRSVLEVLDWDEELKNVEDWDFWLRCHKQGFLFRRVAGFMSAKIIHGEALSAKRETEAYYHARACLKHGLPIEIPALRMIRIGDPSMIRGIRLAWNEAENEKVIKE